MLTDPTLSQYPKVMSYLLRIFLVLKMLFVFLFATLSNYFCRRRSPCCTLWVLKLSFSDTGMHNGGNIMDWQ
eukprot:gene3907-2775_t